MPSFRVPVLGERAMLFQTGPASGSLLRWQSRAWADLKESDAVLTWVDI